MWKFLKIHFSLLKVIAFSVLQGVQFSSNTQKLQQSVLTTSLLEVANHKNMKTINIKRNSNFMLCHPQKNVYHKEVLMKARHTIGSTNLILRTCLYTIDNSKM